MWEEARRKRQEGSPFTITQGDKGLLLTSLKMDMCFVNVQQMMKRWRHIQKYYFLSSATESDKDNRREDRIQDIYVKEDLVECSWGNRILIDH